MSFLNALPLPVLALLGFAVLGLYDYLKTLHTWRAKIKMFSNYNALCYLFFSDLREKEIGFICGCIHPYVIL